jgi:agmatinase
MEPNFLSQKIYFADSTFDEAAFVLWGLPWDSTTSFRPGSRFAPQALREAFEAVESYSPYCQKDLQDFKIYDAGNLELPFGDTKTTLDLIRLQAGKFLAGKKKLISIGGEHLLSYPLIESYHKIYAGKLHVLHLDAHTDLREEYQGTQFSHATTMQLVEKSIGSENISYFFTRSASQKEWQSFKNAAHTHCLLYPYGSEKISNIDISYLKGKKLYLSIDIDVFDPSIMPGTGVVDAGGIFFPDFLQFLDKLNGYEIVGFDLMELAPEVDSTHASAVVAAKILRETILRMK